MVTACDAILICRHIYRRDSKRIRSSAAPWNPSYAINHVYRYFRLRAPYPGKADLIPTVLYVHLPASDEQKLGTKAKVKNKRHRQEEKFQVKIILKTTQIQIKVKGFKNPPIFY